jgi:hypothetical protein
LHFRLIFSILLSILSKARARDYKAITEIVNVRLSRDYALASFEMLKNSKYYGKFFPTADKIFTRAD